MYLVFSGQYYYARGGMNDYQGFFYTLEAARGCVDDIMNQEGMCSHDWWQIVDHNTMKVIEQSEEQAYGND